MPGHLGRCPYCREAVPDVKVSRSSHGNGREEMRRGLLAILLAAVMQYFAGGYSNFTVPVQIVPLVTTYLIPLLFFAGVGLLLYGGFLRLRS
jgi:hypothetical protein